ncbi:hypothetical protein [Alicyclobacillus macrosporangiidus]|uniref:hypothetical protein n=1 Tax=Alicyclobacillus macrosporangiidus TaxID=392015 RepID=UPI0004963046|nr:hypothetical protein [Alicyclobacillus macrosporangiidus]
MNRAAGSEASRQAGESGFIPPRQAGWVRLRPLGRRWLPVAVAAGYVAMLAVCESPSRIPWMHSENHFGWAWLALAAVFPLGTACALWCGLKHPRSGRKFEEGPEEQEVSYGASRSVR